MSKGSLSQNFTMLGLCTGGHGVTAVTGAGSLILVLAYFKMPDKVLFSLKLRVTVSTVECPFFMNTSYVPFEVILLRIALMAD